MDPGQSAAYEEAVLRRHRRARPEQAAQHGIQVRVRVGFHDLALPDCKLEAELAMVHLL